MFFYNVTLTQPHQKEESSSIFLNLGMLLTEFGRNDTM